LLIISSSVNILLYSFLQSQGLVTFSVVLQYIFQPLLFIFFVLLIVLIKNESVLLVSLSYFFSIILIGGGGGVYSYYKFRDDFNQLETESIPFRLKELSEYFIGNSLGMLIVQSYVVLSGLLLPAADVAIIAVSDRISLVINLFAMSISTILAPKVASLYSQSKMNEIKELTKKAMFFIMIPCVLMALLFPFFSGLILSIFGVQYSNASEVLIILVMTQIINAIFCPVYVFLNMSDRQGFISKLHIYMLIPSLVITFYLTNIFGVVGIAVSKLIVVSLINIIPLIYCILLSNRVIK
ncbi:O-antigen flippase, partial [Escherichia coli]|nr:O-antigen flippase [Escherichia coli]